MRNHPNTKVVGLIDDTLFIVTEDGEADTLRSWSREDGASIWIGNAENLDNFAVIRGDLYFTEMSDSLFRIDLDEGVMDFTTNPVIVNAYADLFA